MIGRKIGFYSFLRSEGRSVLMSGVILDKVRVIADCADSKSQNHDCYVVGLDFDGKPTDIVVTKVKLVLPENIESIKP